MFHGVLIEVGDDLRVQVLHPREMDGAPSVVKRRPADFPR